MKLWKLSFVRLIAGAAALAGFCLVSLSQAGAVTNPIVTAFTSKDSLQPGMIVALDSSAARTVKIAPASLESTMYGVVVDPSDAPFTLDNGQQSFVATSGIYRVLVSSSNGAIKPGDYISMSSLDGIGAKATTSQTTTLGQAESGFDGTKNVITNTNGQAIGRIFVNINVIKNPLETSAAVPSILKRIADGVANKPVPILRIYSSLVIFIMASIASITILYSGIRSSIISLGRNPLNRHAIMNGLYKVILTGVSAFAIGLVGVYLLLKI